MISDGSDNVVDIDYGRPSWGSWTSETASAAEFDRRIAESGLFERNFREVKGYLLTRRPNREHKDTRIDRILMPGPQLKALGWTRDIGVELKRSGEKIGPALAQAIDYTYCAWNVGHHWLMLENVFLWPFPKQYRALESIMLQNRVGVIYEQPSASLVFQLETQVIRCDHDGSPSGAPRVQVPTSGRKVGSR